MRAIALFVLAALLASSFLLATPSTARAQATALSIGSITREHIGQTVTVRARIVDVRSDSAGVHFVLDDRTGKIQINLVTRQYNQKTDRAGLNYDADVRVTATVVEVETVLQLDVTLGSDVSILTPGSSDNTAVRDIDLLGTRYAAVGTLVAIEGRITQIAPVSSGLTFYVADERGTLRISMPNRLLRYAPAQSEFVVGAAIRIVGRVGYSKKLGAQLTPALGYDVKIKSKK